MKRERWGGDGMSGCGAGCVVLSSKRKGKGVIDGRSKQPTGKGNEF